MKKINFKYSLLLVGMVGLLFAACEEGDQVIDQIIEGEQRGAALRTVSVLSNSVAINSATNVLEEGETFGVIVEFQDNQSGGLLQDLEVYLSFNDNTDDDDNSRDEILINTIPASEFTIGEFGLPRFEYSITAQEMQTALGLADTDIGFGGDEFVHRFRANLTDGRSFTSTDNSGTLTGSYFNSPWQYSATVVCAPSVPTAGDWIFDLQDSFGDGFNGASLSVVIDGGDAIEVTMDDGSEAQVIVNVPDGSETISIIFNSGAFDEEISFQVTSANGNEVINVEPTPTAGAELLDYCPDNL